VSFLQSALELADQGFYVFPLEANTKIPAILDFPHQATRDAKKIKFWWTCPLLGVEQPFNIGIYTGKFKDNLALIVVDVDNKEGKNGDASILELELQGQDFPPTREQTTPTGGCHLFYSCDTARTAGRSKLAKDVDICSYGTFVLGNGSKIGLEYRCNKMGVEKAPQWLLRRLPVRQHKRELEYNPPINKALDIRAIEYAKEHAPLAIQGSGGDATTYQVACKLKDFGISKGDCWSVMAIYWNDRCSPPWTHEELYSKIQNAYSYGIEPVGINSPQTQFKPIKPIKPEKNLSPFEKLNSEYAFVIAGGGSHILWETKDYHNKYRLEHLSLPAFHQKLAAQTMNIGENKFKPMTELWMKSEHRRSYDGICFAPGEEVNHKYYNLWKGFAVEPTTEGNKLAKKGLAIFLDHVFENVCESKTELYDWLMGYFAHLVQCPGEKPLVGLVFRGGKGVGKNALVDTIGHLLGSHYLLTSNRRYLIGNFNGHLENCLLFALDEAFWSGDKQAEGTLKDLITGRNHVIEHKGKEPYIVKNCTRVAVLGNEEWLVPASQDERRFAVFDVGDKRKQDTDYFTAMRHGLEGGGYGLLLGHLYGINLFENIVNQAPRTRALLDQKISSLNPVHQWWLECLQKGTIVGCAFTEDWPSEIERDRFLSAYRFYSRDRNIRSRIPGHYNFGKSIRECLPNVGYFRKRHEGERIWFYKLPGLDETRKHWEEFVGQPGEWIDE
jgi:hypothetical protein